MRIIDTIRPGKPFVSLEFFPPKERSDWPAFFRTAERLALLNPLFVSVTYGAGGTTYGNTLEIVTRIRQEIGLETMAHLTCIGSYRGEVLQFLDELERAGVDNVLALRGDLPQGAPPEYSACRTLLNASDLVTFIRSSHPHFGIGVAGYPETHPEAESPATDLDFLRLKLDQGGDFVVTQLFFDNRLYFDFVRRARELGVDKPIIPGIIPVFSLKMIRRIVSLCGATIPDTYMAELEEADRTGGPEAVQEAGVAFARRQAQELLDAGVPGIHLYTLNRDEAVTELVNSLVF